MLTKSPPYAEQSWLHPRARPHPQHPRRHRPSGSALLSRQRPCPRPVQRGAANLCKCWKLGKWKECWKHESSKQHSIFTRKQDVRLSDQAKCPALPTILGAPGGHAAANSPSTFAFWHRSCWAKAARRTGAGALATLSPLRGWAAMTGPCPDGRVWK